MSAVDEIWKGDLLKRRAEADLLIGYIESLGRRVFSREDGHAQTIAVDGGYGEGKSFFLKRLGQQLALNHPVATVDAWTDDLADDPLTAIAATLDSAFGSSNTPKTLKRKWEKVRDNIGAVAKIVVTGAAKRALSIAITSGAVEAVGEALKDTKKSVQDAAEESAKTAGHDLIAGAEATLAGLKGAELMRDRVSAFRAGQTAISDLKVSLAELVKALDGNSHHRPVVVIVDELDRCRPTYALKLLEVIKHLFDVPGIVFVLGMNGDQLAHSVQAAYGPKFEGAAYLRRFIGRSYQLKKPAKWELVQYHLSKSGIASDRCWFPQVIDSNRSRSLALDEGLAWYVDWYEVPPRDVFRIIDMLQTCAALTGGAKLLMPYLLPLIVAKANGGPFGAIPQEPKNSLGGTYSYHDGEGKFQEVSFADAAAHLRRCAQLPLIELSRTAAKDYWAGMIVHMRDSASQNPLAHPSKYPALLEAVGRFSIPDVGED